MQTINTRQDLDAIAGTPEHAHFMQMLQGSMWTIYKDDAQQKWELVESNALIERFGFTRADFPDAVAPDVPEYVTEPIVIPSAVTMRQARLALLQAGLLDDIETAINSLTSPQKEAARIEWEYSQEVQRHNGFVSALSPALGLTEAQIDQLFIAAAGL